MNRRSTGSPRTARIVLTVGVIGAAVVAIAARAPSQQQQPPTPPVAATTDTQATVMDVIDSMAAATPAPVAAPAPTRPRAQASAWPVDAAGRTLINGKPVIGRVFVQTKMDGLEAYEFANVYKGEAAPPDQPIVATNYTVPQARNARRLRGMMIQATLWEIDHKRSATELRHHRPSTPASRLATP